jgi:hypothetical protein
MFKAYKHHFFPISPYRGRNVLMDTWEGPSYHVHPHVGSGKGANFETGESHPTGLISHNGKAGWVQKQTPNKRNETSETQKVIGWW